MTFYYKSFLGTVLAAMVCFTSSAEEINVKRVRKAGPYTVNAPVVLDSVTLDNKKYSADQILDTPISLDVVKKGGIADIAKVTDEGTLNLVGFTITTSAYTSVEVKTDGPKLKKVYIAGAEGAKQTLIPGQYDVVIKYVADTADLKITIVPDIEGAVSLTKDDMKRPFNLDDNMEMKRYNNIALSPSGKFLIKGVSYFDNKGKTIYESQITETATGRILQSNVSGVRWMPKTDRYYTVKEENGNKNLIITNPLTGNSETIARNIPSDNVTISPTEDYLIYYIYNEGPKKQDGVYEVVHPDDRQPNYRGRYSLGRYDFSSGLASQLTYGYHNTWLQDISHDGKYILFSITQDSITSRPSDVMNLYMLNIQTMAVEEIIHHEGFASKFMFVPNTTDKLIIQGTPEAFGGIGRNLPSDMTPSMYDYQLYIMDIPTRKIIPVTKHFNPSVASIMPSYSDGMIYFTANNADSISLYRLTPANLSISMISQPMQVITHATVARNSPTIVLSGTSACIPDRLYSLSLGKKTTVKLLDDLNEKRMSDITLGVCESYRFKSKRGYDLTGFYYLPADMDKNKKYPVIVQYYGGCSPTSLRFGGGSHYPAHYWNALGYVVLVINPSGAAGFGQEWAARHVNTAGEGVAEDLIEATEWFADNNSFVDREKIGCVSASYGGFMTQVLLSKTNIFACGISHAGISSHTSYWGEGYWGYSYSQVSMANSYPWNRKDLYVERSPIYNADKIKKPILFTHGSADTNVPIGESIQMYTAMKILGVPTAFVVVEGEDHGIMDYAKRKKWINTMVSWFDRWLKGDSSWWNAMYPEVKQ